MDSYPHPKRENRVATYRDCGLLLLIAGGCGWVHGQTQHYELRTLYMPGWMFAICVAGPVLGGIYFVRRYQRHVNFSQKGSTATVTFLALIGFVGLLSTSPRVLLLMQDNRVLPVQELDVVEVYERHHKQLVSTQVGIRYGDTLLRFEASRAHYFLLSGKRCIRAEIGQAAPGFYYIRNLQLRPGELEQVQSRLSQDRWDRVGRGIVGTGRYMLGISAIILAGWLLGRVLCVRSRLGQINW